MWSNGMDEHDISRAYEDMLDRACEDRGIWPEEERDYEAEGEALWEMMTNR